MIKCIFGSGVAIRRSPDYDDKLGESVQRDAFVEVEEIQGSWVRVREGWLPLNRQRNGEAMFEADQRHRSASNTCLQMKPIASAPPPKSEENIQVFARFRPVDDRCTEATCVEYGDDGTSCTLVQSHKENVFNFSRVFTPWADQHDLYDIVAKPIITSVTRGFNGAIIAYGQTGSGKTHTMVGPNGAQDLINGRFDSPSNGIIPRALLELQAFASPTAGAVKLRVSYIEIYQEKVLDLLSPDGKFQCNSVRQDAARGLWLPEVTEMPVQSASEAMEIMRVGNEHRTKAATEMNSDSSRSHAIFIVTLESHMEVGKVKFAQLYLVDLAGSERLAQAPIGKADLEHPNKDRDELRKRMEETMKINQSLLALSQVIAALSSGAPHVPYRDSRLTRILQNCLGGNARTSIIVTGSPLEKSGPETLSTLRFGDRAAMIKNVAKVNISISSAELKKELARARDEVAQLRSLVTRLERDNNVLRTTNMAHSTALAHSDLPRTSRNEENATSQENSVSSSLVTDVPRETSRAEDVTKLIARRLFLCEMLPSFICPLAGAVMHDPVFAMDGYTYERLAIEKHIRQAGRLPVISPMIGLPFASKTLVPNPTIKQLIQRHLPDLPPLKVRLPDALRIGIHKIEIVCSFLDGITLGRAQLTCGTFLAAGSAQRIWEQLLASDYPEEFANSADVREDARKCYVKASFEKLIKTGKVPQPQTQQSTGLHLFSPAQRIQRKKD